MNHSVVERFFHHIDKLAQVPVEPLEDEDGGLRRLGRALVPAAVGAAGVGVGTLAGKGTTMLIDRLSKGGPGPVPAARAARIIAPIAGGLAGLAYGLHTQHVQKEMSDAFKHRSKTPPG